MSILENIRCHQDLVNLTDSQRETLCAELRAFLVENVSRTGGHVASNLGVVELTVALETVFDTAAAWKNPPGGRSAAYGYKTDDLRQTPDGQ